MERVRICQGESSHTAYEMMASAIRETLKITGNEEVPQYRMTTFGCEIIKPDVRKDNWWEYNDSNRKIMETS